MAMGPTLMIGHDSSLAICTVSVISRCSQLLVMMAAPSARDASATPDAPSLGCKPAAPCESAVDRSCNGGCVTLNRASGSETSVRGDACVCLSHSVPDWKHQEWPVRSHLPLLTYHLLL